jgi:hypothetical protein
LTIGQIYFLNKSFISKQTEDRDFLYRIIVGKPLIEDSDEFIYQPLSDVGKSLDYSMDDLVYSEHNGHRAQYAAESTIDKKIVDNIHNNVTDILKKAYDMSINQSKEALITKLEHSKPTEHVQHILKKLHEGITGPRYFGMQEYIQTIVDYIKNNKKNKFKQYEILAFLKYITVGFVSKDENDFPASKMTDQQINKLIIETVELSDDHPYKWTAKRKNQIKNQDSRYRKMVYINDFLYLWKLYIVNTTPIQEITEADIRTKFIIDMILYKVSFEYSTERIILNKMDDVCVKRLKKVLQSIISIIKEYNTQCFSIYNLSDIWLENQIKNQFIIRINGTKLEIGSKAKPEKKRMASPMEIYNYLATNEYIDTVSLLE